MKLGPIFLAAAALASCAARNTNLPDASNDFDCALTTKLFLETSQTENVGKGNVSSLISVHNWYASKLATSGEALPSDEKVSAMLLSMGRDLKSSVKTLEGCVARMKSESGAVIVEKNRI